MEEKAKLEAERQRQRQHAQAVHAQTMKNMQQIQPMQQQRKPANGIMMNKQQMPAGPIVNTRVVNHPVRTYDVSGLDVLEDDQQSVLTIPQNDQFLQDENINATIKPRIGLSSNVDDTISIHSNAKSVQLPTATGLRGVDNYGNMFAS